MRLVRHDIIPLHHTIAVEKQENDADEMVLQLDSTHCLGRALKVLCCMVWFGMVHIRI